MIYVELNRKRLNSRYISLEGMFQLPILLTEMYELVVHVYGN